MHRERQRDRAGDVVIVVHERLCLAVGHGLEPCTMDDSLDAMLGERTRERGAVPYVRDDQRQIGAGEPPEPRQYGLGAVGEIVEDQRGVARSRKRDDDMRTDIAGAAGDQDSGLHRGILPEEAHRFGLLAPVEPTPDSAGDREPLFPPGRLLTSSWRSASSAPSPRASSLWRGPWQSPP